jgi:hypothetical protein
MTPIPRRLLSPNWNPPSQSYPTIRYITLIHYPIRIDILLGWRHRNFTSSSLMIENLRLVGHGFWGTYSISEVGASALVTMTPAPAPLPEASVGAWQLKKRTTPGKRADAHQKALASLKPPTSSHSRSSVNLGFLQRTRKMGFRPYPVLKRFS